MGFKDWMNENSSLRDMIANGKDKLEWSRKVDQGAVNVIQGLITGDNFKDKMGEGVIKDTLMRKLTCKTMMEILPSDTMTKVQEQLVKQKLSSDFETVLGLILAV